MKYTLIKENIHISMCILQKLPNSICSEAYSQTYLFHVPKFNTEQLWVRRRPAFAVKSLPSSDSVIDRSILKKMNVTTAHPINNMIKLKLEKHDGQVLTNYVAVCPNTTKQPNPLELKICALVTHAQP